MSKEMTVLVLGFWVLVLPYLGIPGSWRTVFLVVTGLALVTLGFLMRGEKIGGVRTKRTERHPFVENVHYKKEVGSESDLQPFSDTRES